MLDYVLTFSLAKLVVDDELCAQALHFVRDLEVKDDLPALDLARGLLAEKHLLTHEHTTKYWQKELYLPGPVYDRTNREQFAKAGGQELVQRASEEVDRRLAAFVSPQTDPAIEAEMLRIIRSGLDDQDAVLPDVLPPCSSDRDDRRGSARGAAAGAPALASLCGEQPYWGNDIFQGKSPLRTNEPF